MRFRRTRKWQASPFVAGIALLFFAATLFGRSCLLPLLRWLWIYRALTLVAQHCAMKNRGEMSAMIESLQKDQILLAAYLEAADRIDWRALNKPVMVGNNCKATNLEAARRSPRRPRLKLGF